MDANALLADGSSFDVVDLSDVPAKLSEVVALADANRAHLGHFPAKAFAAEENRIVVALGPKCSMLGYCMYYVPARAGRYTRIIHLCVAVSARGGGVGHHLVEAVRDRSSGSGGLRLKCRNDFPANELWPRLGFEPLRQIAGRGKRALPLTEWRLRQGESTLLDHDVTEFTQPLVALDTSVFSDLYGPQRGRRKALSTDVALLVAAGDIVIGLPRAVLTELNAASDEASKNALLQSANIVAPIRLPGKNTDTRTLAESLLSRIPSEVKEGDPSLAGDARVVADAVAGRADVLVMRDPNAVRWFAESAADLGNLIVLDSSELAGHIERVGSGTKAISSSLLATELVIAEATPEAWHPERLHHLLNNAAGETKASFRTVLRAAAAASTKGVDRWLVTDPEGLALAAWAVDRTDPGCHRVPVLRVADVELASGLAGRIALELRDAVRPNAALRLEIRDHFATNLALGGLEDGGFVVHDASSEVRAEALAVRVTKPWVEVIRVVERSGGDSIVGDAVAVPRDIENRWWPVKVSDNDVPSWVVPIRPDFADELLGRTQTLFARSAFLALAREQVYFRSSNNPVRGSGRLLWYSSDRDKELVAVSMLVDGFVTTPEAAHRAYGKLGVLDLAQIQKLAGKRDRRVNALRFANTEVLQRPVPLDKLREGAALGVNFTFQSPTRISAEAFIRLYEGGSEQ